MVISSHPSLPPSLLPPSLSPPLRYMIFLSPYDIGYALCLSSPIQLILYIIEEFARAKKVYNGVAMAAAVYPQSMLAMAVVGMLKGTAQDLVKIV